MFDENSINLIGLAMHFTKKIISELMRDITHETRKTCTESQTYKKKVANVPQMHQ
jgi:hypothetical protein